MAKPPKFEGHLQYGDEKEKESFFVAVGSARWSEVTLTDTHTGGIWDLTVDEAEGLMSLLSRAVRAAREGKQ